MASQSLQASSPDKLPTPENRIATPGLPAGILVYLVSIAIVAGATVGAFFGASYLLLERPAAEQTASSDAQRRGAAVASRHDSTRPHPATDSLPEQVSVAPAPAETKLPPAAMATASAVAALSTPPASHEAGSPERSGGASAGAETVAPAQAPTGNTAAAIPGPEIPPSPSADTGAGVGSAHATPAIAAAPPNPPPSIATGTPGSPDSSSGPHLSTAEIGALLTHGDAFFRSGDVSSARLFYERASDAGDGRAALRMGTTFDPAFLGRGRLRDIRGDPAEARSWYRRARDLGVAEADRRLKSLDAKSAR